MTDGARTRTRWILLGVLAGSLVTAGAALLSGRLGEYADRQRGPKVMLVEQVPGGPAVKPSAEALRPFPDPDEVAEWTPGTPPPEAAPPRRVVLICVDTLRADHTSLHGYERDTTPHLAALAKSEGVVFEQAHSHSSWTLPSVASVFTSVLPPEHGAEDRGTRIDPALPTLAGAFAAQGWLTAAFVSHIYVSSLFGLDGGFLEFRELSIDWNFREGIQLTAGELNRFVFPWLQRHRSERFFLYLHYFDPHLGYTPPPPFDRRFTDPDYSGPATGGLGYVQQFLSRDHNMSPDDLAHVEALYDGEILYTDSELAHLFAELRRLGMWDDTLIVLYSDHGEELQDHDSVHHIRTLYEEVLHVPLLVKPAGGARPSGWRARVPEVVPLVDVAPTVLELAGLRTPPGWRGRSLVPLLRESSDDRDVLSRSIRHNTDLVSWLDGRWKLIHYFGRPPRPDELYDLNSDAEERTNLATARPARAVEMRRRLEEWLEESRRLGETHRQRPQIQLSPEQREHLRALGYL